VIWVRVLIAVLVAAALLKVGFMVLGGFARPVPAPPPPGELRKVRLTYRCSICSTEVRMTAANDDRSSSLPNLRSGASRPFTIELSWTSATG